MKNDISAEFNEFNSIYEYNANEYAHLKISDVQYYDDDTEEFEPAIIELFGRAFKLSAKPGSGKNTEIKGIYNYAHSTLKKSSIPEWEPNILIVFENKLVIFTVSGGERANAYINNIDKKIAERIRHISIDILQNNMLIVKNFVLQTNKLFLLDPDYISIIEWVLARIHGVPKNLLQTTPDLNEMPENNRIHEEAFGFCNNELTMLGKILSEDSQVHSNEQTALAYICLIEALPEVVSNSWKDNIIFPNKHRQPRVISIDDAIKLYYNIDHINRAQIVTIGSYVCYLMNDQRLFSNESSYYANFSIFSQAYLQNEKNTELLAYKSRLSENPETTKTNLTIDVIDLMTGVEFEAFIADMFSRMNYRTQVTKATGDQGIDVIAENDEMKIGIQAKCYSGNVGNSAIQEVVGGKNYYNVTHLLVVTNNYFTESAIRLAQVNNVILWDRYMLKEKLLIFNE